MSIELVDGESRELVSESLVVMNCQGSQNHETMEQVHALDRDGRRAGS